MSAQPFTFAKATKEQARARIAIIAPSGGGKTYTGLLWATHLASLPGDHNGRVAVIDTEHASASKYADLFDFDMVELRDFRPSNYILAARAAETAGYAVVLIDSLSHAWMGKGGLLEQVDNYGRSHAGNSFAGWRDATPQHTDLIEGLLSLNCHLITTMRQKTEYAMQQNEKGRLEPVKIGLAPVQRDGLEYEHDIVVELTVDNVMSVSKTRCPSLRGLVVQPPTVEVAERISDWLTSGAAAVTADDLAGQVKEAWDDVDALRTILAEAQRRGLNRSMILRPDNGTDVTLGDWIAERGRYLSSPETQAALAREQAFAEQDALTGKTADAAATA